MYQNASELYDALYAEKDYAGEAEKLISFIQQHHAAAHSLLDIGCGTGSHHGSLKEHFQVEGLDLDLTHLETARKKHPNLRYYQGNMEKFGLEKTYDVICSLFSAIGYVHGMEKLIAAFRCMHNHLNEAGLLLIEPWIHLSEWGGGRVHSFQVEHEEAKISRIDRTYVEDEQMSVLDMHYLVGTKAGVQYFQDEKRLYLYTKSDYLDALRQAGFQATFDTEGLSGRGLYIARKA